MSLLVLGDDLERVRRRETLEWLVNCQRDDGSFGEVLGEGERVEGARDMRFCCCASGIRYVLRGPSKKGKGDEDKDVSDIKDIDVDGLVGFLRRSQVCYL